MDGIIGLTSNILSTTLVHPIDVIKTNFQISRIEKQNNVKNIIAKTYRDFGIRGFYKGLTPNILTYPIFWGIFFQTRNKKINITEHYEINKFLVSFGSACFASFIANPLFVLKVRLQSQNKLNKKTYFGTIKEIYKSSGIIGYYRGMSATIFNNFKLGIQFPLYDYLKSKTDKLTSPFASVLISSSLSKIISSTPLYPLDLIRVIQRNSGSLNILQIFNNIVKKDGYFGLYRGVLLYNSISTLNFVVMMCLVEEIKKLV